MNSLSFARRLFLALGLFLVALALACGGSPAQMECPPTETQCGAGCIEVGEVCCETYRCAAGDVCEGFNDAGQGLCGVPQ